MSRSQSELSLKQREILQLVIYRTKNPKHLTFFGGILFCDKEDQEHPDFFSDLHHSSLYFCIPALHLRLST